MTGSKLWTSPNGRWSIFRANPGEARYLNSVYAVVIVVNGQEIGYGWVDRSGRAILDRSVDVEAPKYVKDKAESLLLRGAGRPFSKTNPRQKRPDYKVAPAWEVREQDHGMRAQAYERGRDAVYQLSVYTAPHSGMTYYDVAIYARTPKGERCILNKQGQVEMECGDAFNRLMGELSSTLSDIDRIVEHTDQGEFFSLPGSPTPRSESSRLSLHHNRKGTFRLNSKMKGVR